MLPYSLRHHIHNIACHLFCLVCRSSTISSSIPSHPSMSSFYNEDSFSTDCRSRKSPLKIFRSYEVFLSYRGEDTRASFTAHLNASLLNAGINVFKDDDSIYKGARISKSLPEAIEQSRIAVVVFSKHYADSKWCLNELVKIMKCHRAIRQIVLPVFYDVDPLEVRHQKKKFGKAFQNILTMLSNQTQGEGHYKEESSLRMLRRNWTTALHEAAGLAGFVVLHFM